MFCSPGLGPREGGVAMAWHGCAGSATTRLSWSLYRPRSQATKAGCNPRPKAFTGLRANDMPYNVPHGQEMGATLSACRPPRQCHRGSPSNLPVAATLARSPPRWSPSMSRSVNAHRGGFCPRLCAALLGFRRRACLRMPCDAILCEFWVCDEMGSLSSSRLDAPTGCEVRFCLANAELSLLGSFGFLAHTRSLRTTLWVAFTQALCSLAWVPSPGLPTLALRSNLVRILGLRRNGEPIKFSHWCSHRMWSSILLSQMPSLALLASWHIHDLCGLRSEWRLPRLCAALLLFALSGDSHPANVKLGEFSHLCGICTGFVVLAVLSVSDLLYRLVLCNWFLTASVYRPVYFSEFVYRMAYGVLTTAPTVVRSRLTSAYNNDNEMFCREFVQWSCQETSYRELVQRYCIEISVS